MAYIGHEKKAKVKVALEKAVPPSWRYSLRVDRQSTFVLTVTQVTEGFVAELTGHEPIADTIRDHGCFTFNHHWPGTQCTGAALETMCAIIDALNLDNYRQDSEDPDTTHVGHYLQIRFGKDSDNRLKILTSKEAKIAAENRVKSPSTTKIDRALDKVEKERAKNPEAITPAPLGAVDMNW